MAATIASNSQKWIASQLSATAADARPSRTEWYYVRDRNDMMLIDPIVGFYFNPPPNAKCRWSTDNGARPPQPLTKGIPLPPRNLVLWDDKRLESEAARIREKRWDEMKTLVAPQRFEDLYEYFDSATLYFSGVVNLWNLINLLANDARHNWREVEKQVATECNNWVLDWLEALPGSASNRESLVKWNQKSDILTAVTSQFDWENDLKALDLVGQNFLRECFLYHFERLTGKKPDVARFYTHAAESKPTSARKPMMAAAGTTSKASTIEPQPIKEAEDVSESNDRKDKIEDDFLTNQDLADRVQITARQLSSQSTPGERQESMLNPFTNDIPPRAVSATDTAGVSQPAHRLQHTFSERSATIPRNMYGNKASFRGPPRSPQGYGPNRQQIPANMLPFSGERSFLQQRAPIGPSKQQHMGQAFGPPNNGMQPPPPGFIPPTSTQGVPSNPDGFPPPAKGLQMDGAMEPILGLPTMEFQNQMPVRPPHMEPPQLSHPEAPHMSMPPQYMGQQNVGVPVYHPMYQANGYIHQSQKQLVRDKGNKKRRPDDRRDSINSNGSRSKVRDDPIHGPVYALKSRKDSNTPTGPQSSNSDGCLVMDSTLPSSKPNLECKNNRQREKYKKVHHYFVDCPCPRCVRASKSLFIRHDKLPVDKVQPALLQYLGGWGAVKVNVQGEGHASIVVFNSDHDAVRAMQDLCSRPNGGRNIPGLGQVTSIWYAWYSKHYTHPCDNPTGMPRALLEAKGLRRRSSSTLSRDSNPFQNQQPNNIHFNTPNFNHFGPSQQQPSYWADGASGPFHPNMVRVYQPPTQRGLWEADSADQNRKPSKTESRPKNGLEYQPKTYPKRPDGVTASKEDWRSKPPAEEVIEDISSDEAAAADSLSNVSSQGARGIKVCLPNETGSSRSRSVSPHAEDVPSEKQVRKDSPESRECVSQEGGRAERGAVQDSEAEAVAKDDDTVSSGYRKATAHLAVPVEEFQPTVVAEQAQPVEKHIKKGPTSYSKVSSELTEATENFDINTVIRHKSPRSPLPKEWMDTPEQEPSNLQDRFGALSGALQLEALGQQVEALVAEGTNVEVAPESPKAEEAPTQKYKARKHWNKSGKAKKTKSKASNNISTSTSSSATSVEAHSRGASQASNNRPVSRTSNNPPESAAGMTTQSPTRSQPATKKKNNKSQRKRKQPSTAETSGTLAGNTKDAGSEDQVRSVAVKESPTKKPKSQHSGPEIETQRQAAPEPSESVNGTQSKGVVENHDDCTESSSQIDADVSVRVEKDRSPQKPAQMSGCSDKQDSPQKQAPTDLEVVFEIPAGNGQNNCSPEANLFPNQKFTIDKVKRDSAVATPPAMNEPDVRHRQPSAMHLTTKDARIALPLLPPNSKPTGWSSISSRGPRSKSDDPFTTVKGEPQPEGWLRDKAVKTPQKPSSEPTSHQTSPTPSPKKKTDRQGGTSRLNAAAKSFEPSSIPPSPTASHVSVLSAATATFHAKKPSLPGQKGPVEQRLVTPAEQVTDPSTVTQPGPPAKEKKRAGPAPDRGGGGVGGQKERAKSSDAALAALASTKKTVAQVASAVSIAPKLVDEEEFPTLAAAAAVPQRRASWAVKASATAAGVASKTVTAVAPKTVVAPKPPVTSPNNVRLGQRGDAPAQAADKQGVGVGEKAKTGEDQWTTVGSGKKAGGKKNGSGNNRSTSGKSGGGATGQGGRAGGQGTRSGKAPIGEERKGG
ncbi:hypothetical protein SLS63_011107 [Diaporthe eres]|uniref:RRM domain-containing protein n=1 Tax=Diaporthe eres TaxID=83184 RepID=A0ABR1NV89_DIAER